MKPASWPECARARSSACGWTHNRLPESGVRTGGTHGADRRFHGLGDPHLCRNCGGNRSAGQDWLRESITARVGGGLLILGDVEIALDAAFPGRAGVLVLAGTGSNVVGRTSGGKLISAGGWGPALADQGSGHSIGLESLRAIFLAKDEERETRLLPAVLEFWQLSSLDHLVEYANTLPAPDFSTLTGVVLRCAELGDEIALAVLRKQGEDLAYLVRLVIRRLQRASTEKGWTPPLAFAGSILENVPPGSGCLDRSGAARVSRRASSG